MSARLNPRALRAYGALALLLLSAVACTPSERTVAQTQLIVRVSADPEVRAASESLRLRTAWQSAGSWSVRAQESYPRSDLQWPVDLVLVARSEDDAGKDFEVVLESLSAEGEVLVQTRAITSFVLRQARVLTLSLAPCGAQSLAQLCEADPDCHGPRCQTCVDDTCAATPRLNGRDLPRVADEVESDQPDGAAPDQGGLNTETMPSVTEPDAAPGLDAGVREDAGTTEAGGSPADAHVRDGGATDTGAADTGSEGAGLSCPEGYQAGASGCVDIDECQRADRGGCGPNASCRNKAGGRDCVCDAGFEDVRGDGSMCRDRCQGACDAMASCVVVGDAPVCSCPAAYTTNDDGRTCTFDASCSLLACDANATCVVSAGNTRACRCRAGYRGTGMACTNIDECTDTPTLCGANRRCTDTQGGYTCACVADYQERAGVCERIDDCANSACGTGATSCQDGVNTRSCSCGVGYTGTGTPRCADVNECASNNGGCDPRVLCTNTNGGRSCGACPSGYTGSGETGCVGPWPTQLGTNLQDSTYGLASDASGSLYLAGITYAALDGQPHAGGPDAFLTKFNAAGQKQWTRLLGSSGQDFAHGAAGDGNGNIYVVGYSYGSLDGNPYIADGDLFVVKYNSAGEKQWTRELGSMAIDAGYDVKTDASGNVFIGGATSGSLDGNTSAGASDMILVKYNAAGVKQWTAQYGSAGYDYAYSVAVDGSGNAYIAGQTDSGVDGNSNAGATDLVIVKYNTAGVRQWTRQLGSAGSEYGNAAVADATGNVYVAGYTTGALDGNASAGSMDIFVTKYDPNGTKLWTRQLGSGLAEIANGIALDGTAGVYVTGRAGGALDGNPGGGATDLVLVKFNAAGLKQWTRLYGSNADDFGEAVATTSDGVFVGGTTYGSLPGRTNAGDRDAFVAKFAGSSGIPQ